MPPDADSHHTGKWPTLVLYLAMALPIYILSAGPVAWATNDGLHDRYLPDELNVIYAPLQPLTRIPLFREAFYWYTAVLWRGWPAGYTTL